MSYLVPSTQVAPKSPTNSTSTLTLSIRALSGDNKEEEEESGNSPAGKKHKKAFDQRSKSARSARLLEADYERRKRKYIKWALAVINVVLIVIIGILAHCKNIHFFQISKKKEFDGKSFAVLSQHSTSRKDKIECVTSLDNCPHQHYKHGDGFCDDDMNIPECDYDGQDCCRESVIDYFCIDCRCYESGCEGNRIDGKNETTTTSPLDGGGSDAQNVSYCIRPQWVGDGECDQVCNTEWCEFDGGDCEGEYFFACWQ